MEVPIALNQTAAEFFAALALDCINREFPNKISHALNTHADVKSPRELTPVFFGCYDWHSAVHNHWILVRLLRLFPLASFASEAKTKLARSITDHNITQELHYLQTSGREAFERPYGLAWLLQLAAELRQWTAIEAHAWVGILAPLEAAAVERLTSWLSMLHRPIRTGEHNNTAFSMSLMIDYGRIARNGEFVRLLESRAYHFYAKDTHCPISYEPSGEDFLSPCLAEADLVRRLLPADQFAPWFNTFLPQLDLEPTFVPDIADGKLGHLIGLNLSRAWMLTGIAAGLPENHPRRDALAALAKQLAEAGLSSIRRDNYQGAHWLGTFAVYQSTS